MPRSELRSAGVSVAPDQVNRITCRRHRGRRFGGHCGWGARGRCAVISASKADSAPAPTHPTTARPMELRTERQSAQALGPGWAPPWAPRSAERSAPAWVPQMDLGALGRQRRTHIQLAPHTTGGLSCGGSDGRQGRRVCGNIVSAMDKRSPRLHGCVLALGADEGTALGENLRVTDEKSAAHAHAPHTWEWPWAPRWWALPWAAAWAMRTGWAWARWSRCTRRPQSARSPRRRCRTRSARCSRRARS